jgi:mono/diheme cytochrome c family protein
MTALPPSPTPARTSRLRTLVRGLGALGLTVAIAAAGTFGWATWAARSRLSARFSAHTVDFPIPMPLTEAEIAALRAERTTSDTPVGADVLAGVDLAALARDRAAARGQVLLETRYGCTGCHGANLGGGTMVDDPAMGRILGRNLTRGVGGVTASYTAADWDRLVRHAIKPDGTPTLMPAVDFASMSDRELSDLVTFIQSLPPVDADVPPPTYGPVGTLLMATGQLRLGAEFLSHDTPHPIEPPADTSPDFGKHITQVCTGCHNQQFSGGPVAGGPPDWPAAGNLTPHADGLAGWTLADFKKAMREGVRKNGAAMRAPMSEMQQVARKMSDRELEAMFGFLQSLPPTPTPRG